MLIVYFPVKIKVWGGGGRFFVEASGFTVSIYEEGYDFCQGITHSRLSPFLASKSKLESDTVWRHLSCV